MKNESEIGNILLYFYNFWSEHKKLIFRTETVRRCVYYLKFLLDYFYEIIVTVVFPVCDSDGVHWWKNLQCLWWDFKAQTKFRDWVRYEKYPYFGENPTFW